MPQPDNTNFSIDYHIYENILNPLAEKLCFIHPNIVTISGGLLTIPMFYNLLNNGDIIYFVLIGFIKMLLDCFDGSLARKCKTGSKFGALLDIFTDTFTLCILGSLFIYKIYDKKDDNSYNKYLIIGMGLTLIYFIKQTIEELRGERNENNMFKFKLDKYVHDNIIVLNTLAYYLMKKYA